MQVVRIDEIEVLVVLPPDHGELAVDLSGKQSHPLIAGSRAPERRHPKGQEVAGLNQFGPDRDAAIRGVGCVEYFPFAAVEFHESSILYAIRLRESDGKDNA